MRKIVRPINIHHRMYLAMVGKAKADFKARNMAKASLPSDLYQACLILHHVHRYLSMTSLCLWTWQIQTLASSTTVALVSKSIFIE